MAKPSKTILSTCEYSAPGTELGGPQETPKERDGEGKIIRLLDLSHCYSVVKDRMRIEN
jgi:hypothetical protein